MNTNVVLLALMGVLVLMAGIQAFQLVTISHAISSGVTTTTTVKSTGSSVLSQLSQASQVGGCG
ncbi:MAG: hypothetical protein QW818_02325 [Candidatus Aenigmatarchaeota archaeon]|nr:hypothetical protein [Candidatus Aenigmarchaeota archaeon]